VDIVNDSWWHLHWEMIAWGLLIVTTVVSTVWLWLTHKYITRAELHRNIKAIHEVTDAKIHLCRVDIEDADREIVRRQEKCADDLGNLVARLSDKIDHAIELSITETKSLYKLMLEIHQK
jgi:hypothetical protein